MNTEMLVKEIKLLQAIQKSHPTTHPEWVKASALLAPRFAEMAKRVKAGEPEAMAVRL